MFTDSDINQCVARLVCVLAFCIAVFNTHTCSLMSTAGCDNHVRAVVCLSADACVHVYEYEFILYCTGMLISTSRGRKVTVGMYAGYMCACVVARLCACMFWPVRAWECGEGFLWYF